MLTSYSNTSRYQLTLENTIKKETSLFSTHFDTTPQEYMRYKLAPKKRGQIIEYIVCSLIEDVPGDEDDLVREQIIQALSNMVKRDVELSEALEGEDRRNFVTWCCEQTEKELKNCHVDEELKKKLAGFGAGQAEEGEASAHFLQDIDGARTDGRDSGDEFYTDGGNGGAVGEKDGKPPSAKQQDKARLTKNQQHLATTKEEVATLEKKLDTPEFQVRKSPGAPGISKEARKQLEDELKFKKNKVQGLSTLNATLAKQRKFLDEQDLAEAQFNAIKQLEAQAQAAGKVASDFAASAWAALSPAFGETGVDDFPTLRPSGLMKLDMEMQKVRGPYRMSCIAVKRWKAARGDFIATCQRLAVDLDRCPPTTLKHALNQLASIVGDELNKAGCGVEGGFAPSGGVQLTPIPDEKASERADTLADDDGRVKAHTDFKEQVGLRIDSKQREVAPELREALAALSVLACQLDWRGGDDAEIMHARLAEDQLKETEKKTAKKLRAKLKKLKATNEMKKEVMQKYEEWKEKTEDAESIEAMQKEVKTARTAFQDMFKDKPGGAELGDVFKEYEEQVDACEKQVASDGHGLGGMMRGSWRMVKTAQSHCPTNLATGKELGRMSIEALEIIDSKLPDTNLLAPFDSGIVEHPLDIPIVDLDTVLKPPEWMRQMTLDLSGTGQGVANYMLTLVKSILHPVCARATGQAISEIAAKFASSVALNLASDVMMANPATAVLLGIKKAFKCAKMSYKLVNKGIKLKRSLDRALLLRRMKNRLKARCKARATKSIKELASLGRSTARVLEMIEKDKQDVKTFVEVTLPALGKVPKKKKGMGFKKSKQVVETKPVVLALPEVLALRADEQTILERVKRFGTAGMAAASALTSTFEAGQKAMGAAKQAQEKLLG